MGGTRMWRRARHADRSWGFDRVSVTRIWEFAGLDGCTRIGTGAPRHADKMGTGWVADGPDGTMARTGVGAADWMGAGGTQSAGPLGHALVRLCVGSLSVSGPGALSLSVSGAQWSFCRGPSLSVLGRRRLYVPPRPFLCWAPMLGPLALCVGPRTALSVPGHSTQRVPIQSAGLAKTI